MKKTKKTETVKTFKEEYAQRKSIKTINECSWFCIVWGILLSATCFYQALCTQGVPNIIYKIVAVLGLLLLVIGSIAPLKFQKIIKVIKSACSVFGNALLKVILLPVYLVMSMINAVNYKKYVAKFGFKNWEERHRADTAFYDFNNSVQNKNANTILHTVVDVLSFFISNRMYIVIPIIIILLIVGAVMFFASSSAVFSFVYTLF